MSDRPMFACRLVLPFAWDTLGHAPTADILETAAWSNAGVVRFLLHETDVAAASRPAEERFAEALAPVQLKLEMIIEMLGRLAYRDLALPPPCAIELGHERVAWHVPKPLKIGGWLRLRLYFHPTFLEPIVLYARVAFCGAADDDAGCAVQAELDGMPEPTAEAFARLAFLAQRRQRAKGPDPNTARHAS